MKIVEFNHKTVCALLKKSVAEFWKKDKDAWVKFTDGTVVCIHMIEPTWDSYMNLTEINKDDGNCFNDDQGLWYFSSSGTPHTSRTVSIYFDRVKYYYHKDFNDYAKREYLPVIEFHFYEKGENIGNYNP